MSKKSFLTSLLSVVMLSACGQDNPNQHEETENTDQSSENQVSDSDSSASQENEIIQGASSDQLENSFDVVVVGAGGGGMAAAIEAHDAGSSVAIFEKMPIVGGNTKASSGGMNAAGSSVQEAQDIEDDPELFFQESLEGGHGENDEELLRYLTENAADAIDWLDSLGITLDTLSYTGGMSQPRAHRPTDGSAVGEYLVEGLSHNIDERDIPVFLNSQVHGLIEDDGEITGLEVDLNQTEQVQVEAGAVIVATGGFGANFEMLAEYDPELEDLVTTNHEGATGDGLKMIEDVGGNLIDMDQIQVHPTVHQEDGYLISESVRGSGAILVNQEGQRFVDEMETRDYVSESISNEEDGYAYIIGDAGLRDRASQVDQYDEMDLIVERDSIENLAQAIDIDPEVLSTTLDDWNQAVDQGEDPEFNRTTAMDDQLNEGPFLAIQIAPGIHHTMGGAEINTLAQVISTEGQVIPGLYAAGETTGGVHGANRIGGNAVADIIVFGRQAGKQAADYTK
ncbi:flavocytochrome c [Alloiococcus otitis]|nr:flavocytochrome c [Alloiococcus otitis]